MSLATHISKHIQNLYYGGNWTGASFNTIMEGVDLKMAMSKVDDLNTIATLVYHINYYVPRILEVLKGNDLVASDKDSFELPALNNEEEWQNLLTEIDENIQLLIEKVAELDDSIFWQPFSDGKYGNYFRNLNGFIEHSHYHLGQIALIKKLVIGQD